MPKIGLKERREHANRKPDPLGMEVPNDTNVKTCAALECNRCGQKFDNYQVVCHRCGSCLYCGLIGGNIFACHICGNNLPEEDRVYPIVPTHKIF